MVNNFYKSQNERKDIKLIDAGFGVNILIDYKKENIIVRNNTINEVFISENGLQRRIN